MNRPGGVKLEGLPVWAFLDGVTTDTLDALPGADPDLAASTAAREGVRPEAIAVDSTVFAMNGPLGLTLVDTGAGAARGPRLGWAGAMLAACGFAPEAVDAILVTHMHARHVAGLLLDGRPAYPRASIYVGRTEAAWWATSHAGRTAAEERWARAALHACSSRLHLVDENEVLAPGLVAVGLPGHTPGMLGFRWATEGHSVLFCGDLVRVPALQLPTPALAHLCDEDAAAAAATRLETLEQAARHGTILAAAHLPYPATGHVWRRGSGFGFLEWSNASLPGSSGRARA